jgi:hypothetical protein
LPEVPYYLYAHPTQASSAARRLFEDVATTSPRFGPAPAG